MIGHRRTRRHRPGAARSTWERLGGATRRVSVLNGVEHGERRSTARSRTRSAGRYAGGRAGHHHTDRRRCP
ncbi:hypothetical protein, partial [Streptomyces sp. bgisy104]|uniref:hypothetical protein n=1 Tax=Streptomyces sp. bgisy104 TaxID=3413785 RepID=UPI003EB97921